MAPLTEPTHADETESLVLEYRRLARHLAQRYVRPGEPPEDLEQVAYVGLIKAARRFDPARGVAFTTYAVPTVLGELRRFCRDTRWAVHVPRPIQQHVQALRALESDWSALHGRSPSPAEAADALGWTEEEVLEARLATGCLARQSLNVLLQAPDGTMAEAIETYGAEDDGFAAVEQRDELGRALARLSDDERRAIRLRGDEGCSTPEIAGLLGISTPQAARLVSRALRHLRVALTEVSDEASCSCPPSSVVEARPL